MGFRRDSRKKNKSKVPQTRLINYDCMANAMGVHPNIQSQLFGVIILLEQLFSILYSPMPLGGCYGFLHLSTLGLD
jgi:hypothetical protein